MKKSSSENILTNCVPAKPPLCTSPGSLVAGLRLDTARPRTRSQEQEAALARLGGNPPHPASLPTSPTESSPFRSAH